MSKKDERKLKREAKIKEKKEKLKEFYGEDDSRNISDKELISRLFKYIKPYTKNFIIIIISVFISSFLMSYLNITIGWVVTMLDGGYPEGMFISSDIVRNVFAFSDPIEFIDITKVCLFMLFLILSSTGRIMVRSSSEYRSSLSMAFCNRIERDSVSSISLKKVLGLTSRYSIIYSSSGTEGLTRPDVICVI